ncbi:MAG: O-antigen ligase family protein [Pseudobacter sp.]|uniref:O-antigen ligase family protein n=1 Tax=Pseudobacter sp. TaxID=2045420 RepID=UPI003F7E4461
MEKNLFNRTKGALTDTLRYHLVTKKLNTPLGFAILGLVAMLMSYVTVVVDVKLSVLIVGLLGVLLLCGLCIVYPLFGFYAAYITTLFMMLPARLSNSALPIPTGLIPEYLAYLAMLGVLTKQQFRSEMNARFWKNAIMVWMLVLVFYYIIQLANPSGRSILGWFNFFRKQVSFVAFFYISYCLLNSRKAIKQFTWFWVGLSTFNALFACQQQWFGFARYEEIWLMADEKRYALFVNFGFIRRFGLLSDPAAAGILYSCSCVMVLVLALRSTKTWEKVLYWILTAIHFMASSYTGTRTGTMMIVAGMVFYVVLNLYEKKTLIFSGVFAVMIIGLLVAPIYNNMIINRLRSTFEGSKDPSAMARDLNRAIVQPYAYTHPIGGGLNSSGNMGQLYHPGHPMSMIPPDSGFMQTMMEQGPIGLALLLIFYYALMRTGIKSYYRLRDPELKTLLVCHFVSIFTLMVAQYSQLAVGQYPSVLYFYSVLALLVKMPQYDENAYQPQIAEKN